jgi:hypothetical protein
VVVLSPEFTAANRLRPQLSDDERLGTADEASDLLWFCADIASRRGVVLADAVDNAFYKHDTPPCAGSLRLLGQHAVHYAGRITVPTKLSLTETNVPLLLSATRLDYNPLSVFLRLALRTAKSIVSDLRSEAQPLVIDFEPPQPTDVSVGEFVIALAYTTESILNVPIEDVARFNIAKLQSRKIHGKGAQLIMRQYMAARFTVRPGDNRL